MPSSSRAYKIPGVKRYTVKGKEYCYHRKTKTLLVAPFGSAAFFAQIAQLEGYTDAPVGPTIGDLISTYKATPAFARLAPRTKRDYEVAIKEIRKISEMVLTTITHHHMVEVRDRIGARRGWRQTNHVLSVLSVMFNVAVDKGMLPANPVSKVKKLVKPSGERRLNRRWSDEERRAALILAPHQLKAPLAMLRYMGLRLGDMIALRWDNIVGGKLMLVTAKRAVPVELPLPAELVSILEDLSKKRDYVFVNLNGKQWTGKGFDSSWRVFKKQLEITKMVQPGLTLHGLRHSLAHDLREKARATDEEIAYALGQRSPGIVTTYTRTVDMAQVNLATFERLYPTQVSKNV